MALIGQVSIGSDSSGFLGIADWYIGRLERWDGPIPEDAVNTYHWWVQTRDPYVEVGGELQHRYGDGAVALVAKVLAAGAEQLNQV